MSDHAAMSDSVCDLGFVRIRRKRPSDALDDFHWHRDPELSQLNATDPYSGSYSTFLDEFERRRLYSTDGVAFSIETESGFHIGNVMYYHVDSSGGATEYGITIGHRSFHGAGIGTAVTVAFLRMRWQTTSLRRVELHVLERNERAIRCFRSAGFEESARVLRMGKEPLLRMDVRREWWLLWDAEGRYVGFDRVAPFSLDDDTSPARASVGASR